jgi:diketogulonate reductase-like aldo/keto reductase|eukprot:SAG25_NODE_1431_length_3038_cov_1.853692_2_plen_314_part_00
MARGTVSVLACAGLFLELTVSCCLLTGLHAAACCLLPASTQDNDTYASSGVVLSIKAGFRSIDTANDYFNQVGTGEGIGTAISSGMVTRDELFVTSKVEGCGVPHPPHGTPVKLGSCYNDTLAVFAENLGLLKLPSVDLMLVHKPPPGGCSPENCPRMQEQWAAFEHMLGEGKAKSIGVSNYCVSCLECLAKTWKVVPVVNQIQLHVGMGSDPEGLVSYCHSKNIQIQAYSPLDVDQANGTAELINGPLTNGIGRSHNKSGATVALKWLAQHRIPFVTKAHSAKYLAEDIDLFGWELTEAEMTKLVRLLTLPN